MPQTNKIVPPILRKLLTVGRPTGTEPQTRELIKNALPDVVFNTDAMGNLWVRIDARDGSASQTLFTAHMDTVDHTACIKHIEAFHAGRGDENALGIGLDINSEAACLGADDAAGIYVLYRLIKARVPGLYLFFVNEERGGTGSSAAANMPWIYSVNAADWSAYRRCISFDRRETTSVITHQACWRGCSDSFATALAAALNTAKPGFAYAPDDGGIFTDSANFIEVIPECTNLSVGYYNEHTPYEWLNITHLKALAKACVAMDWEALPTVRDPKQVEVPVYENNTCPKTDANEDGWQVFTLTTQQARAMSPEDLWEWAQYAEPAAIAETLENLLTGE